MTPPSIRLLSQLVKVSVEPNLHVAVEASEDHEGHAHKVYGTYQENDQTIILDDGLGFERARETFLHENLHAILAAAQVDDTLGENEESIVSALAPIMLAWLRDNPEAISYLTEVQFDRESVNYPIYNRLRSSYARLRSEQGGEA